MISKEDLIEILELLFQLNQDKNYSLSDLEIYKYQKLRDNLKKEKWNPIVTEMQIETDEKFTKWRYC